ncbi:glycosyltransferase [Microbacterium aquimaris]|uniref:Glycosyltransferase family 2 protein n=1 Tax=Microbacterium aquimaris TaxID=459816 RepID=A0ABU5N648_9MICO|nr:glycosyltransferase family 2 protein [Microbacterium aquimaris]MDZ8161544.1 glycosyltransferase family 2 protein [Microbacterium aquimaris]
MSNAVSSIVPMSTQDHLTGVVRKNQWRDVFDGTVPKGWEPSMSVSVIIAAYNSKTLPLTLASLAAQDYPEHLLEVIVVDDGSEPPVEIGEYSHPNTTLIRVDPETGWGRSNATYLGIEASKGDIIYWVDSDMVLFRDNVREHAKWAHFIPEAATIGQKGFVEEWDFTPESVYTMVGDGTVADLWDPATLHEHWSEAIYRQTDDLNASDGRNYSTHMGACASVTRAVYEQTLGQDRRLRLGEDTEIAYQIWQAGGVFIPARTARSWHLGRGTVQDHADKVAWHNNVHFAQRMPIPRYRRTASNRTWEVPLVRAVVEFDMETVGYVRACVDRILNSTETDVQVDLVGPWHLITPDRRRILADPDNEIYLVKEWFRSDSRVRFLDEVPETVFPSPYRLDVPVTVGVTSDSVRDMYRYADQRRLGLVYFMAPGHSPEESVRIWDNAAVHRAQPYVTEGVSLVDAVDAVWGVEWAPESASQVEDLRAVDRTEKVVRVDSKVADLTARLERTEWLLEKERRVNHSTLRRGVRRVVYALARRARPLVGSLRSRLSGVVGSEPQREAGKV